MRARNIKPGFFQNEYLVELEPQVRLLFIGLWLMADREGRLEDRPKKIKMQVFPADSWDVDAMLQELHDHELIVRYEVDSKRYILIPAWDKHQNPHVKERPSTIPAPDSHNADPVNTDASPADSLIPDSLNPSPPGRARKRAPTDFKVSMEMCDWVNSELGLSADTVTFETKKFMDHTFAAAKKDWPATWRNWMRRVEPPKGAGRKPTYSEQLKADMASKGML